MMELMRWQNSLGDMGGALGELLKCKRLDLRDKEMSALTTSFFFCVTPYVIPPKKVVEFFTSFFFLIPDNSLLSTHADQIFRSPP